MHTLTRFPAILASIAILPGCGGSHTTQAVGGTVTGLDAGKTVVLQNGGDTTTVIANGGFTFATPHTQGSSYQVTVRTQPPGQLCTVNGGTGTVGATGTYIVVSCAQLPDSWNWVAGADVANASGTYGSLGVADAASMPGARYGALSWLDASGNAWLLGGQGYDSAGTLGALNDMWEYSGGKWTWVGGANTANAAGTYGTQGDFAASNIPGARFAAISWVDAAGDLWVAGGQGYDSTGTLGLLNDLWEYSGGQWRWISGSNTVNALPSYGTQGIAAPSNMPGARFAASSWIDGSGTLWMLGGLGFDSTGNHSFLNDLWEYSAGQWRWVSGSNTANTAGTYGTLGVAAPGNTPGARLRALTWVDSAGNLWLFGGLGFDSIGAQGALNDLWEYSAGQWIWMGGSSTVNAASVFGTKGVAAAGNVPGARYASIAWNDSAGNVWLFGGQGLDSIGNPVYLDDLWELSGGQWKWVSGSNVPNVKGTYGTQGVAAPGNVAGARYAGVAWIDSSGRLWQFGGVGYDSAGMQGGLNDLWSYSPP
jgi:hypothetical protein